MPIRRAGYSAHSRPLPDQWHVYIQLSETPPRGWIAAFARDLEPPVEFSNMRLHGDMIHVELSDRHMPLGSILAIVDRYIERANASQDRDAGIEGTPAG